MNVGLERLTRRKAASDAEMDARAKALAERVNGSGAAPMTIRQGVFTSLRCGDCGHRRTTASPERFADTPCPCRGCAGTMRAARTDAA